MWHNYTVLLLGVWHIFLRIIVPLHFDLQIELVGDVNVQLTIAIIADVLAAGQPKEESTAQPQGVTGTNTKNPKRLYFTRGLRTVLFDMTDNWMPTLILCTAYGV